MKVYDFTRGAWLHIPEGYYLHIAITRALEFTRRYSRNVSVILSDTDKQYRLTTHPRNNQTQVWPIPANLTSYASFTR